MDVLPVFPDVWNKRTLKGIRCRGGFVVDQMDWSNNALQSATITSTIGGKLRLRSAIPLYLNGEKLSPISEKSESNNVLLKEQGLKKPLISPEAPMNTTIRVENNLYEIDTTVGGVYTFTANQ